MSQEIKDKIINIVNSHPGITNGELVIRIFPFLSISGLLDTSNNLIELLQELINNREIVELEYILPTSNERKSIYFPKGTMFGL
jgi:hypothetical protein